MSKPPGASSVTLPEQNPGVATVLEYLINRFSHIDEMTWLQRVKDEKVHREDGLFITEVSPYEPQLKVYYYREVEQEPRIPFLETVVFEDEHILVAHKPHFLPVMPMGRFVNECLQRRLITSTGIDSLQAIHRLDRDTAGLVLFSKNPKTRSLYHELFTSRQIKKSYQAISHFGEEIEVESKSWEVKNRLVSSDPSFLMQVGKGEPNSYSRIKCLKQSDKRALFELSPVTGKTHQLRVHMAYIGYPILNDRFYPELKPLRDDDFSKPLQLLAKTLSYIDPVTKQKQTIRSEEELRLSFD